MASQNGRNLLIKIDDGASGFITVAGLRTKTLKFGARSVDITHSESDEAWRELLPGGGVKSIEVSGQGVFRDGASDIRLRESFFAQSAETYQIIIPDFGTIEGAFIISALNYAGSYNGEASYEISLSSAAKPDFTAL